MSKIDKIKSVALIVQMHNYFLDSMNYSNTNDKCVVIIFHLWKYCKTWYEKMFANKQNSFYQSIGCDQAFLSRFREAVANKKNYKIGAA